MKIEIFDLAERLSSGNYIWRFGSANFALVVSFGTFHVSVPFDNADGLPPALIHAANILLKRPNSGLDGRSNSEN